MTTLGLLIGGQAKAAFGERMFERRNPFTGEVATTAALKFGDPRGEGN